MTLADLIAQSRTPFAVENLRDGKRYLLDSSCNYADRLRCCPLRYVLGDELVALCADLAYSRGTRSIACADLLRIPARELWIEWQERPWSQALSGYGFPSLATDGPVTGRRGALLCGSEDGRRGTLRTFWNRVSGGEVFVSNVEAYFDFDTAEGEKPRAPNGAVAEGHIVSDWVRGRDDILGRCFRFRYEQSWGDYYRRMCSGPVEAEAVWRHSLGTMAHDAPLLLAFFLLLSARAGLPRRVQDLGQLNRARRRRGKPELLPHIEVMSPVLPEYLPIGRYTAGSTRRSPRLHHVRGHLVRRDNQLFWRVPHLRGSARAGRIASRTVVWTFD
jgi:hypothetical protein